MKIAKINAGLACGLTLLAATTTHAQNLLVNGGFGQPQESAEGYYPPFASIPGWTTFFTDAPGSVQIVNGTPANSPGPFSGNQCVLLQSTAGDPNFFEGLSQLVDITVAGRYQLSWYASAAPSGPDASYSASFFDQNNNIIPGFVDDTESAGNGWNLETLTTELGTGNNAVQFGAFNGNYVFLDHVELTLVTVPDAGSTLWLSGLAFSALAAGARKMRRL